MIFDRSWSNRAGIEYVLGFCSKAEHRRFFKIVPEVEQYIVDEGEQSIKYGLKVSEPEQRRRFEAASRTRGERKLSPTDLYPRSHRFEYSKARDMMLEATDTTSAPWYIVPSDDKRCARLNCIRHLLSLIPYKKVARKKVKLPARSIRARTASGGAAGQALRSGEVRGPRDSRVLMSDTTAHVPIARLSEKLPW